MNLLLATFWENYGFLIILLVLFVGYMLWMFLKNKKDREAINNFQVSLKPGDKVVTGSGIYGTVEKIVDTTDGKVVTLKISENSFIDVNMGAIYNIDSKTEVTPELAQPNPEEVKATVVEPTEEQPKEEVVEEQPENLEQE